MDAFNYAAEAELFDYETAAEIFSPAKRKGRQQPVGYRRFARAADAIRFAIEELPPQLLASTYLEVNERRYQGDAIHRLYASANYPLDRCTSVAGR